MTATGQVSTVEGEVVIEWEIMNFFALSMKFDGCYFSPSFPFCNESFYLSIWPNGQEGLKSVGYIDLLLHRESPGPPISLEYCLGLKTQNETYDKIMNLENIFEYDEDEHGYGDTCLSRSEFLERKSEFAPSNCLTVVCKINYLKPAEITNTSNAVTSKCCYCGKVLEDVDISFHQEKCLDKPIKCPECGHVVALKNWYDHKCQETRKEVCNTTSSDPVPVSGTKALADFKELLLMQEGCDVIIKVKDQEFQAHRAILRARSSVFASAFRNDMKEKKTGTYEIEDCDPSSFPDFLSFLYCGNVEKLSIENTFSLFVTADKYDVQDLKLQCLDFIKNNLSASTFCNAVTLALRYNEEELLQLSIDFLAKNLQEVMMTVEWQSLLIENPIQCNELAIKALNRNKN